MLCSCPFRPLMSGGLTLIGLGLGDLKDITVRGLEAIKNADYVYLENYTSLLVETSFEEMRAFYGASELIIADREFVEMNGPAEMISKAKTSRVCFLVVGDPFCATTHTDLVLRARAEGVEVSIVHNASIVSAVGCCGLQVYRFGEIISIPLWIGGWKPTSFYDKLVANAKRDLHTLCLLDIKVKEKNLVALARGREGVYDAPRFMTVMEALSQLSEIEEEMGEGVVTSETRVVGLARVGRDDQVILSGTVGEFLSNPDLAAEKLGRPLHSLVICASTLHELEQEFIDGFKLIVSKVPDHNIIS